MTRIKGLHKKRIYSYKRNKKT